MPGNLRATFISKNVEQILGYQPTDFVDQPGFFTSHIHPDDVETVLTNLTPLCVDGFHKKEYRFLHNEGHYVWIRDEFRFVYDDAGNPVEIVGYFADISELKNAEVALEESKTRWQFALEGAGDGVWDWNAKEGTVVYSTQWKAMLGYAEDEIQNQFSEWDKLVHPEDKDQALQDIDNY